MANLYLKLEEINKLDYLVNMGGWESKFYFKDDETLLKIYDESLWPEIIMAKKMVIDSFNNCNLKNLTCLVMPDQKVYVDGKFKGNTLTYIPRSISLLKILQDKEESLDFKINILKEILEIINIFDTFDTEIYLNDIHEGNFIWDLDTLQVKAIDLDSAYQVKSIPQPSLYLNYHSKELYAHKKKYAIHDLMATPNHNTMYLCFIYIFLNTLLGQRIRYWSIDKIQRYLDYLNNVGLAKEILDAIALIYTDKDNIFPKEFLNMIDPTKDYRLSRK